MREILFRGKGNKKYNDGGWYYGVPIQCSDGDWQICTNCSKRTVIAKTIGQYTGLTDKNGTKIFDGDILESNNGHIGWVRFRNGRFEKSCYCHPKSFNAIFGDNETVIGNIYDNPKLFKIVMELYRMTDLQKTSNWLFADIDEIIDCWSEKEESNTDRFYLTREEAEKALEENK